jgi:hypothetical protein
VIKLPQPLDFVRYAKPCRIFALLQINDGLGPFDFGYGNRISEGACPGNFVGLW